MLKTYGVEAARASIVKEIKAVFDVYGISVDFRHLSLIADFMTYSGGYRPFNRIGMEESPSPFQKMSYETTMSYMAASAMQNDFDSADSPSASLVLGLVPKVGTGVFSVLC